MNKKSSYNLPMLVALLGFIFPSPDAIDPGKDITEGLLFRIERSKDPDEVWYAINFNKSGTPDREMPVKVFWVRKDEGNRTDPLTGIQKRFAYGIETMDQVPGKKDAWNFRIAAYNDRIFTLKRSSGDQYKVYTPINGQEVEVLKLFVMFDGGTFLRPKIAYVRLTGLNTLTGETVSELITGKMNAE